MSPLAIILTTIISIPVSVVWSAYVLTILWGWFIVPQFGLEPLTIRFAIGLSLIITYLTYKYDHYEDDRSAQERFYSQLGLAIIKPLFALFFGWIIVSI